jgi:hypothetical protein
MGIPLPECQDGELSTDECGALTPPPTDSGSGSSGPSGSSSSSGGSVGHLPQDDVVPATADDASDPSTVEQYSSASEEDIERAVAGGWLEMAFMCTLWHVSMLCQLGFNLQHFIFGDVRQDKLKGVHWSTPGNLYWALQRHVRHVTVQMTGDADPHGVWRATVSTPGAKRNNNQTMFPGTWSLRKTLQAINFAFTPREDGGGRTRALSEEPGRDAYIIEGDTSLDPCHVIHVKGIFPLSGPGHGTLDTVYPLYENEYRC